MTMRSAVAADSMNVLPAVWTARPNAANLASTAWTMRRSCAKSLM